MKSLSVPCPRRPLDQGDSVFPSLWRGSEDPPFSTAPPRGRLLRSVVQCDSTSYTTTDEVSGVSRHRGRVRVPCRSPDLLERP